MGLCPTPLGVVPDTLLVSSSASEGYRFLRDEVLREDDVFFARDVDVFLEEDVRLRGEVLRLADFFAAVRPVDLRPVPFRLVFAAVFRPAVFRVLDFRAPVLLLADFAVRLRPPRVSPASLRCLFTVAAAICFARAVLRPCFCSDSLMCSYCRARLRLFTPAGGMHPPSDSVEASELRSKTRTGLSGAPPS